MSCKVLSTWSAKQSSKHVLEKGDLEDFRKKHVPQMVRDYVNAVKKNDEYIYVLLWYAVQQVFPKKSEAFVTNVAKNVRSFDQKAVLNAALNDVKTGPEPDFEELQNAEKSVQNKEEKKLLGVETFGLAFEELRNAVESVINDEKNRILGAEIFGSYLSEPIPEGTEDFDFQFIVQYELEHTPNWWMTCTREDVLREIRDNMEKAITIMYKNLEETPGKREIQEVQEEVQEAQNSFNAGRAYIRSLSPPVPVLERQNAIHGGFLPVQNLPMQALQGEEFDLNVILNDLDANH